MKARDLIRILSKNPNADVEVDIRSASKDYIGYELHKVIEIREDHLEDGLLILNLDWDYTHSGA